MTDLETAIMIKNMARETVRRMTAKVKNAQQFKHGDKVIVDGKYEGVVQEVKAGYYEVRIFDGSRVVGTRVVWPKDIAARNATGKNANKTTVKDLLGTPVTVDLDNIYVEHHKSGDTFWESRSNGKRVVLSPEQKRVVMDRVKVKGYDWYEPGTEK